MRSGLRCLLAAGGILAGLGLALVVVLAWTGAYDVSARSPHWALTHWLLQTVRERSVNARSRSVTVPDLAVPGREHTGIEHFHEMCRLCHSAPGYPKAEFAEGLYPAPPDLRDPEIQHSPDETIFWIVKNGFKMTGMPSFGVNHSAEEIAGIVAVLRKLPSMTPETYRQLLGGTDDRHPGKHRH